MNPLSNDPLLQHRLHLSRRQLLGRGATGLGAAALGGLLNPNVFAKGSVFGKGGPGGDRGVLGAPHFQPKAKRVIYLFMSGAPSQIDMWDHKPKLLDMYDQDIPDSVVNGQRFTTMTSGQARFPIAPSRFQFSRQGELGTTMSHELLPYTAKQVDKLTIVRSVFTEAINHDPAITFIQTGHEQPGRPSIGAWLSYGLGSMNADLPAFVVMTATWTGRQEAQALYQRLWGSGFAPTRHQGVALRAQGDPVLYLSNPSGVTPELRRDVLDGLAAMNQELAAEAGDPEIQTRIAQYEMAYRMQTSVPDLVDLSTEPQSVLDLYGPDVHKPGTFAASCLLARRLAERDVRCIQIFHRGWDQHGNLPNDIRNQCRDIDQPSAGLLTDLEQRGLLDDTLVVWGGEFGRTTYCQGALSETSYGRDHHPRCYTMWFAGGGMKRGFEYGETDDFSYNIVRDGVHIHDLNATILHCLGVDHERLTYRFQGRDYRLTDVHGNVVHELLA